jgi:carbamoyl-phosphate synthase large subunit
MSSDARPTNVLLTCAGRRNYLVQAFAAALDGRGKIFAADSSPDAPALHEANEGLVVPHVDDPGYVEHLLALCRRHQIRLLISLNDLELPGLARARQRFLAEGTIAVISTPEIVDLCFDKWATAEFLATCGISTPRTFLSLESARAALRSGELSFPVVVKPRWGSASIGIEYPRDDRELELVYELIKLRIGRSILAGASAAEPDRCILIQEQLRGQEYGLDVVNDLEGRHLATFARRKLVMRAGETDRAVTVENTALSKLGETLGSRLGHVGNLDCDIFHSETGWHCLELNPRFGGGYPFSHAAGANLPALLIALAEGRTPKMEWLRTTPDVTSAKCDRILVIGG